MSNLRFLAAVNTLLALTLLAGWGPNTARATTAVTSAELLTPTGTPPHLPISAQRGVALVQELDCEREEEVAVMRLLCGEDATQIQATYLALVERRNANTGELPSITCEPATAKGSAVCTIPPAGECDSKVQLFFEGHTLVRIIERDDWQNPKTALDRRIDKWLRSLTGCGSKRR